MNRRTIHIVIADDNRFFCEALKDSLNIKDEFHVNATFSNLSELIDYTNAYEFNILILDINFNGKSSLDFIPMMKKRNNNFKIIALTTLNNSYIKENAYKSGVDFFVGKDEDFKNFDKVILNCIASDQKQLIRNKSKFKIGECTFTKRKLEILQQLYHHSDKNEKELAKILNISTSSLKTHKQELFGITNTNNIQQLLKFGIQKGLIIT